MHADDLIRLYPELFHVTVDGSWPTIERHGLEHCNASRALGSIAVYEKFNTRATPRGFRGRCAQGVWRRRRPRPTAYRRTFPCNPIDNMSVREWYRVLNERVFFFLQPKRRDELLGARSYRNLSHTVLTIDTASLVAAHGDQIELCGINSGFAQPHSKARRGRTTFQSIADYSHPARETAHPTVRDVAELTARNGLPDIRDHVVRVEQMQAGVVLERLL